MTHTITIETSSEVDFSLLRDLATRLGLSISESHEEIPSDSASQQDQAFRKFLGSWQGDESADELEAMIHLSRNDQQHDVEL